MDLNAYPQPDDEEDQEHEEVYDIYEEEEEEQEQEQQQQQVHEVEEARAEECVESGVETFRREREERRQKMKRERPDDGPKQIAKIARVESKPNDRMKHLPDGWIDCPPVGQPLANLIPSKVPLGEAFNDCISPGKRYSSKQVVHQQRVLSRDLGMIIDLTNTSRYYHSSDWLKQGIKYSKIACKGRDAVPDNESVNNFVYEALRFFYNHKQKGTNKYILVHCTHGHNRTGFMIVHYLVRTQGMTVKEALQRFSAARPPGIYKPDYIDALFRFYNERKPEAVICPPIPEWKSSDSVDINGNAMEDEDDDGDIMAALQEVEVENEVMTNDDVLGDAIPSLQQTDMQKICCMALGVESHGNSHFPGSQPVSLDSEHLQLLRQRYYYATWKADGTRYMMLITRDGCYLIDRKFNFRRVQLRFPKRGVPPGSFESHHLTLLDGEMIIDTVPETGEQKRRYLVYDLMMLNQQSQIKLPFHERWRLIEKEIIEPRTHDIKTNALYCYDMEAFRVRRKDFWMLSAVGKVLKDFIPRLSHEADGLIFQGWDDAYVPRTHDGLLKWKYAHMNSVDFLFEVGDENRQSMYLIDKGRKRRLEGARVNFADDEDPSSFSGKIIECSWNPDERTWKYMRVRPDKPTPNGWNTYIKVMKSIEDNINQDVILEEIADIIHLPMYADRIKQETARIKHDTQRRR